ncbi:transcription termination/antitermination protein NusG [Corynebacterium sp. Marseille-P4321]|uniref:transcription termination/antitermination protein NusG n=1 Tax=Corynebacterium sp. Marseille-P4321 TaxID=2736603 RepID=UPI0020CA81E9|nr:transcription termination/antitermination protein NusG [Corynebacterium sp. Marseille-P4321]
MTEANKDVQGAVENNEQEMIDEGAPVQESTDPTNDGDDHPGGTDNEAGDSSDEEPASSPGEDTVADAAAADADSAEASEVEEEAVQDTDLAVAESSISDGDISDFDAEYKKRLREYTRELKKQPGDWYIIQSYSGYENKVKTNLDMRIQTLEVEDSIYEVVVPVEQVLEKDKNGKNKLVKRKLLPGYVLVRMDMNDAAWSVVRETPGVTSFVGNEGNATPVKHRDVAKFLLPKSAAGAKPEVTAEGETVVNMPEEQSPSKVTHDYQVGEAVTILSGALASVSATINAIDPETGKIEALVSIFGRETPVELTADQIERIM